MVNSLAFFIRHDHHDAITETQPLMLCSLFYCFAVFTCLFQNIRKKLIILKNQGTVLFLHYIKDWFVNFYLVRMVVCLVVCFSSRRCNFVMWFATTLSWHGMTSPLPCRSTRFQPCLATETWWHVPKRDPARRQLSSFPFWTTSSSKVPPNSKMWVGQISLYLHYYYILILSFNQMNFWAKTNKCAAYFLKAQEFGRKQ